MTTPYLIHQVSRRSGGFHAFSVGTVAPQLALDELFGHVQGAYTDARKMRTGRIASAGGGTLLLDDLHTLDLGVQKQLLQVLDRGTYNPVGCDRVQTVACRFIVAMTDDPDVLMQRGQLLKDLRYRFGACAIGIPPLRERRSEISLLAKRALARCPNQTKVDGPTRFSDAALELLCEGEYPGNVRQLESVILSAYLIARADEAEVIGVEHASTPPSPALIYRRRGDRDANRIAVFTMLKATRGNAKEAAQRLGVSRNTVNTVRRNHSTRDSAKDP